MIVGKKFERDAQGALQRASATIDLRDNRGQSERRGQTPC